MNSKIRKITLALPLLFFTGLFSQTSLNVDKVGFTTPFNDEVMQISIETISVDNMTNFCNWHNLSILDVYVKKELKNHPML